MDECKNYNVLQGVSIFMSFLIFGYSVLKKKLYDKNHLKSEDNIITKLKNEITHIAGVKSYGDLEKIILSNNINKDATEKKPEEN